MLRERKEEAMTESIINNPAEEDETEDPEFMLERYELAMERLAQIPQEELVPEPFRACFADIAGLLLLAVESAEKIKGGMSEKADPEELKEWNDELYADILPGHYDQSYTNPVYASHMLGSDYGPLFASFAAQCRAGIIFAYEDRKSQFTILAETLILLYNSFVDDIPPAKAVADTLRSFHNDYADIMVPGRLREQLDPTITFAKDIIMKGNLNDDRYLYRFGDYISPTELGIADFLRMLPQKTIDEMAACYTEGFRRSFTVMGRDLEKKSTVQIRYELGFERLIRAAVEQFRRMGLEPIIFRSAQWSVNINGGRKVGFHATSPNPQYDYDHRFDEAVYYNAAFKERKLSILASAYESMKGLAAAYAGPAVIETFGQEPFHPVNHPEALSLSPRQQELESEYANESAALADRFIPGNETSFTIISFPVPDIGEPYDEIFDEIIRINELDSEYFTNVQQAIIDELDKASYVHITGRGQNETDLTVHLHELSDPSAQTNFENCVADCNIPVGEVFTSPLLTGTDGLLHVQKVYLGNIVYTDLRINFKDGLVSEYSCGNFSDPAEGKALIHEEILKNHESLPMGEFAIGTNTAAYSAAGRYGIEDKLPILIAEKTGPHFALGDTCYSWSEDDPMYNLNGKEVIARDNEISILRKEDPNRAYFGCHTDITIPYSELGDVTALCDDGTEIPIIKEGRFAVPGAEGLNRELDEG